MKRAILLVACALMLLPAASAVAAPILDAGWAADQIDAAATDSVFSPYVYDLSGDAVFSITDAFIPGDTYFVYDSGSLILTTSFFAGTPFAIPSDSTADAAWADDLFSKGSVLLGAGAHSLTIQGDGKGGLPAGFYARLDTATSVPEPGTIVLLGSGLAGLGFWRRFRA